MKRAGFKIPLFSVLIWLFSVAAGQSQDTWESVLKEMDEEGNITFATFKTTRIANGHSVEQVKRGVLDVRINHRFGDVSEGFDNFFGLDNAVTRIGFDYGITNGLMIGVGRSTLNKEYDGFAKVKLVGQAKKKSPVTVDYLAGMSVISEKIDIPELKFWNRASYVHQLLVARKINESFSLQVMPTYLHYNLTNLSSEKNNLFALGFAGRYKIASRTALTCEYYVVPKDMRRQGNFNPLTIGIDIETGGHVFQLFVSNASGVTERSLFTATTSRFEKGELHIGFNISRVFTVGR